STPPPSASNGDERDRRERLEHVERRLVSMFGQRSAGGRLKTWEVHGDADHQRRQAIVRDIVKSYCLNIDKHVQNGTNLLMVGSPGTGKDRMLVSTARAAMYRCHSVRLVSGANLWGETRDMIGSSRLESEFLRKLVETDCLIISDPLPPKARLTE